MKNLIKHLRNLPDEPGVYQYFDNEGRLLYVGKAKSLKKRVRSYFRIVDSSVDAGADSNNVESATDSNATFNIESNEDSRATADSALILPRENLSARIATMIKQVAYIKTLLTPTESDALLLENSLIKTLRPKYNILLRDDKTYPYIAYDKSADFPRLEIVRETEWERKSESLSQKSAVGNSPSKSRHTRKNFVNYTFFGPFCTGHNELLESIYELVPLVQKKSCLKEKKPCMFYQIGRCLAPCAGKISAEKYGEIFNEALNLLQKKSLLIARLSAKMNAHAEAMRFEEAAILRDRIAKISAIPMSDSVVHGLKGEDIDVFVMLESTPESAQNPSLRASGVAASVAIHLSNPSESVIARRKHCEQRSNLPKANADSPSLRASGVARSEPRSINIETEGDASKSQTDTTSGLPRVRVADARNDGVGDGTRFTDSRNDDSGASNATAHDSALRPKSAPTTPRAIILKMFIRSGKIISSDHAFVSAEPSANAYTHAILNHYTANPARAPKCVLLPQDSGVDAQQLEAALKLLTNKSIKIIQPKIGQKRDVVDLAFANADEILRIDSIKNAAEQSVLAALESLFSLSRPPLRIEVFDTSHHAGSACVGGLVAYENGAFDKNGYRHYNLAGADEYSQFREMIERRIKSVFDNTSHGKKSHPLPDLWVLDGGFAQLNLVKNLLDSAGLSVDLVAISKEKITRAGVLINSAKKRTNRAGGRASDILHCFINGEHREFFLKTSDKRLQFIQKLRDEAHRWAISFHRKQKTKKLLK